MDYGTVPNYHIEDRCEPPDRPDWLTLEEYADQQGDDALIERVVLLIRLVEVHCVTAALVVAELLKHREADIPGALDALGWREELERAINDRHEPDGMDEP